MLLQDTEHGSVPHKAFVVASPLGTKWEGCILTEVSCDAWGHVFQVQWGFQAFATTSGLSRGCWGSWTTPFCLSFKQFINLAAVSPALCLFRADMKGRFCGQDLVFIVVLYLKSDWVWLHLSLSVFMSQGNGKYRVGTRGLQTGCLLVTDCRKLMGDMISGMDGACCSYCLFKQMKLSFNP